MIRSLLPFTFCLVLLVLAQWGCSALLLDGPIRQGPYYYQILVLAGINVILAVSLNLTNGVAGQFSIGHAGFFAIGAYVAACISVYGGPHFYRLLGVGDPQGAALLVIAVLCGALASAAAGLLVGIPSLRLRGD